METLWRIEMFGGLRAISGEHVLTRFRSRKTGALLAYLAFYRHRSHPRELLLDLLWPEDPLDTARMKLRTALASLRRQLEPPGVPQGAVIVASRLAVRLCPEAIATDVAQFEAALQAAAREARLDRQLSGLDQAIAIYKGPLLPGYYEGWVLPEQQRLSGLYLQALQRAITSLEQAGHLDRALAYARRAVATEPLREEAHQSLIRLLLAAGQPSTAQRQYRELERLLREELGEAPSPDTRALVESLRDGAAIPPRTTADQAAPEERDPGGGKHPGSGSDPARPAAGVPSAAALSAPYPRTPRLPLLLTRFFGREAEIARLRKLLVAEGARLVTLTGPGGSGKTRLALETAGRLQEALDGAVWFVPLADLADPQRIVDAIHAALGLPRLPQREPVEQIMEALSSRPSLLVLDNLEHLMPAAGLLLRNLLEQIPLLQCLVTSRQILELEPEREIMVGPLPVPGVLAFRRSGARDGRSGDLNALLGNESIGLFVDRAQKVRPHFQLTARNAGAVAELCRRLEGIPLALELAAVQTRELSPSRMLEQLGQWLDHLVTRRRDLPSRHQTLRAALDWSYQLLAPELQRFFARLFPFRGGFAAEAAAAVADEPMSRPYLEALCDCSLVLAESSGQEPRFRLLEILREYAVKQLSPEERVQVAERHAEYYRTWANAIQPELRHGPQQKYWLDRLEEDHDNLRAALDWTEGAGAFERAFQLVALLDGFWAVRSHLVEGQQRLSRLLDLAGATISEVVRARTLNRIGWFTHRRGACAVARLLHEQALEISRRLGDQHEIANSLRNLGAIAQKEGKSEAACQYLEESLAIHETRGDKGGIAASMGNLGLSLVYCGQYERARPLIEQALRLVQELTLDQQSGPSFAIAANLNNLGLALLRQGHLDDAQSLFVQSLRLKQEMGNADGIPYGLEGLAELAAAQGQWARAVHLLAAADAAREVGGYPRYPPSECAIYERLLALAREALGAEVFAVATCEGSEWNAERELTYALREAEPDSRSG